MSRTRDLLVVVPSRGRPGNVARLAEALARTMNGDGELTLGLDEDDLTLPETRAAVAGALFPVSLRVGHRATWAKWTNDIAVRAAGDFRALCSIGDDHVPMTPGWDTHLIEAIDDLGGTGFAYGNDLLQGQGLPTAIVVSSDIVRVLGWMCQPSLRHYYADNVWKALGEGAGCIRYLPDVIIEHRHHSRTGHSDPTYAQARPHWNADRAAYDTWRAQQMAADVLKIKALRPRGSLNEGYVPCRPPVPSS
jgi:hypothetical protein